MVFLFFYFFLFRILILFSWYQNGGFFFFFSLRNLHILLSLKIPIAAYNTHISCTTIHLSFCTILLGLQGIYKNFSFFFNIFSNGLFSPLLPSPFFLFSSSSFLLKPKYFLSFINYSILLIILLNPSASYHNDYSTSPEHRYQGLPDLHPWPGMSFSHPFLDFMIGSRMYFLCYSNA